MSTIADPRELIYSGGLAPALPGPAADAGAGLGPGDIWRVIKQRKLLIIIAFVLLYALVAGATVAVYFLAPLYPAEAVLELSPPRDKAFDIGQSLAQPEIMRQLVETEARKLKHLGLLTDVLKQPQVKETAFYRWYGDDFAKCLYDLQTLVSSTPIPDTQLIRVSFACQRAADAKTIVDTLIDTYSKKYQSDTQDRERTDLANLKDTLEKVRGELQKKRDEIAQFRAQSDVPSLESNRNVGIENIANLTAQLSALNAEATDYATQLQALEGKNLRDIPVTAEMKIIIENDPILRFYRNQVEALDIEIAANSRTLGPEHRYVQRLQAQRDGFFEQEALKREEMIDDLRKRYLETLQQNFNRVRNIQLQYAEQLASAETAQRDLETNLQRFNALLADQDSLFKEQERIQESVRQAEHRLAEAAKSYRVTIAQKPERAIKPSRPDFVLYLGGGFVLCLLGAVGLAFLRELTDTAVRTPVDVARHGHLSVLGTVPLLDDEEADVEQIEHAARTAPQSLVAESFRQVRTNLQFSGPADTQRSLLITSPGAADGKTTVAINLAVTLARSNQKVLLIDCNFRRPSLRATFSLNKTDGLSNILIGQAQLADVTCPTDNPNLFVVPAGRMPPNPAEVLGSTFMRDLLAEALKKYDRVIIDGPPVLLMSDALIIAAQVDAVILVARAVQNSKGALRRAREQLDRINARVVGCVLNGVQARPGGYFKRQYREYYDYTSDETIPYELPGAADDAPKSDKDEI